MVILTHVVTSSAIGSIVSNPIESFCLAFILHFFLDTIPHAQAPTETGYKPNKLTILVVVLDLAISFWFLYFLSLKGILTNSVIYAVIGGVLPDVLDMTRYLEFAYKKFRKFYDFHDKIQRETFKSIGYFSQIIFVVSSFLIIFRG